MQYTDIRMDYQYLYLLSRSLICENQTTHYFAFDYFRSFDFLCDLIYTKVLK